MQHGGVCQRTKKIKINNFSCTGNAFMMMLSFDKYKLLPRR
jgi:hypothetical protein